MSNTITVPIDKSGVRVDPGAVHTARSTWQAIATTASAGTNPTDLAVGERTYQAVVAAIAADVSGDGKIQIYDVPRDWNGVRFRAEGITDGGTYNTVIYFGTLGDGNLHSDNTDADCELALFGNVTWTIGTQSAVDSGYEMADTCVNTQTEGTFGTAETSSPANNRVAETWIDLLGADVIVVVPVAVTADSKLLARGY